MSISNRFATVKEFSEALARIADPVAAIEEAPEAIAARLGAQMRSISRRAMLETMRRSCGSLHSKYLHRLLLALQKVHVIPEFGATQIAPSLSRIATAQLGDRDLLELPTFGAILRSDYADAIGLTCYAFAGGESDCALYQFSHEELEGHKYFRDLQGFGVQQILPNDSEINRLIFDESAVWREVLWFTPGDPNPDDQLFDRSLNRWLSSAMQFIASNVARDH